MTIPGWVRQLLFPWTVCALVIPFLLYWGAWPQAIAVALVAVIGTSVVRHKDRVPTITAEKSVEYSSPRAPTKIAIDGERPLLGVVDRDGDCRYVWLIPNLSDAEWGYQWSRGQLGRRSTRPVVETVSAKEIDALAARWGLRVLQQGAYSDEAWRLHFGRRGRLTFSDALES